MRRPTVKVSLESERATALLNDTHRWELELSIDCLPPAIPTSNCPIAAGHDRRPLAGAWDRAADRTPHGQPVELQPHDLERGG